MKFTLDELSNSLKSLTLPVIQQETEKIILTDKQLVERKQAELKAGINPDGSLIGTYKSESYRLYKLRKNPIARGNVDLIDTGSYKNKMVADSLGNRQFRVVSEDDKREMLIKKYGEKIEGINPEIFIGLQKTVYGPQLLESLKKKARL